MHIFRLAQSLWLLSSQEIKTIGCTIMYLQVCHAACMPPSCGIDNLSHKISQIKMHEIMVDKYLSLNNNNNHDTWYSATKRGLVRPMIQ